MAVPQLPAPLLAAYVFASPHHACRSVPRLQVAIHVIVRLEKPHSAAPVFQLITDRVTGTVGAGAAALKATAAEAAREVGTAAHTAAERASGVAGLRESGRRGQGGWTHISQRTKRLTSWWLGRRGMASAGAWGSREGVGCCWDA